MKTKHLLLFLIIGFNSFMSIGQKFVNPDNEWYLTPCHARDFDCPTYKYWFEDTVEIDNQPYMELKTNDPKHPRVFEMRKFYREENGIVYMRQSDSEPETAIYNFKLNVGDQFNIGHRSIEIIDIDSITLNNGEKRKRLITDSEMNGTTYWIEGIGSNFHTFNTHMTDMFDAYISMNCFHTDNEVKLQYGDCILTNLENEQSNKECNLFPNPTTGLLNITSNNNHQIQEIEIIAPNGTLILQRPFKNQQSINLEHLNNGVYFFKINYSNKLTSFSKIIKN